LTIQLHFQQRSQTKISLYAFWHTAHRSAILLNSKSLLRGRAVSDQAIAEALVSTMLLEDSSPRQALADFLLARKSSIYQLLNQPQHGMSK